jgi:predicted TIM-barrel fold metal-dependent hydrolase
MAALHKTLHIQRVVIVTPSVYGTDKARGADARGVAVIDEKTSENELEAMHRAGIRGIRLNLATGGTNDPTVARERLRVGIDRVKGRNWHVQLYTNVAMISALKDEFSQSPVPIVFDHFAGARAELGPHQPGFADVLGLVKSGKAYVKISGAYRVSKAAPDYSESFRSRRR